jgi:hypothetical protein
LTPSADEATEDQFAIGALVNVQVAPEFVESEILENIATNLVPSDEPAMKNPPPPKAVQFAPEFVER